MNAGNNSSIFKSYRYDQPNSFLILELENSIHPEETYEVYMQYNVKISQSRLNGMYLDFYNDSAGEKRQFKFFFAQFYLNYAICKCFNFVCSSDMWQQVYLHQIMPDEHSLVLMSPNFVPRMTSQ